MSKKYRPEGEQQRQSETELTSLELSQTADSQESVVADQADAAASLPPSAEQQIAELQGFREQALRQVADLKNEMENIQRRTRKEQEQAQRYAPGIIISELLAIVDNMEKMSESLDGGSSKESLKQGLELIQRNLLEVFEGHGVKKIAARPGNSFDPYRQEAMTQIATSEHEPGTVMAVLQHGYMLHDRVLRPSRVIVAKLRDVDSGTPATAEADKGTQSQDDATGQKNSAFENGRDKTDGKDTTDIGAAVANSQQQPG